MLQQQQSVQQQPSVPWMWPAGRTKNGEIRNLWTRRRKAKISMTNSLWIQDFFPGAPSSYKHCAEILGSAMEGSILMGTRAVSLYSSNQPWITQQRRKQLHYPMEPHTSYVPSSTVSQPQLDVGMEQKGALTLHFWPKFVSKMELYFYYLVVSDCSLVHCGNCESISIFS